MTDVDVAVDRAPELAPEFPVPGPEDPPYLDRLVQSICAEHAAAPAEVRRRASELLRSYANARIQTFVPILVEKQLRQTYPRLAPAD
jgi:hypothetical protein